MDRGFFVCMYSLLARTDHIVEFQTMADSLDPEARSRLMAKIRSKNTRPEMLVRRWLWANGFRYRLHGKKLPGHPDIVLTRYRTVVFVHGCFWHGHAHCKLFKLPATRKDFWEDKIGRNQARDAITRARLRAMGWQVLVIWECELKGKAAQARLVRLMVEILGTEGEF
jgi:DNA mismatch endonuclease, patch repair protein